MASSTKALSFNGDELHVLAVDDNVIDRKIVENLLRSSSCKGIHPIITLYFALILMVWFGYSDNCRKRV